MSDLTHIYVLVVMVLTKALLPKKFKPLYVLDQLKRKHFEGGLYVLARGGGGAVPT